VFQFNGYVLDVARGCLRTGDREIGLRPKSFEVLCCLVENADRLVTKDKLFEAVWPNVVVSDEALTQCISEVREAIGDRRQTMIKTMPRRGYRFVAHVSQDDPTEYAGARSRTAGGVEVAGSEGARRDSLSVERPSIAVLPFINLSGDPQQEYFSDGITDDIITELSRFSELSIIARNSVFQYKGKTLDVRHVGRELGVRYVLEGSVQRDVSRVRINAQLIDSVTGTHRWAERYDRELSSIFAVQDEVTRAIVTVIAIHVNRDEAERSLLKPAATWEAYDYYLRGAKWWVSTDRSATIMHEGRRLIEKCLSIDPNYARAYAVLARSYVSTYLEPIDNDYLRPAGLEHAHELARKAVGLDADLAQAHAVLGVVLLFQRRHEAAIAEFERALSLNPNFVDNLYGLCVAFAGEPARAV
jgi:adenylate cyclase